MAIWQFDFFLVPNTGRQGDPNDNEKDGQMIERGRSRWKDVSLTDFVGDLSNFESVDLSVSLNEYFEFGLPDSDFVQITHSNGIIEEVYVRFDVRRMDLVFLNEVVKLSGRFGLLIRPLETRRLISPTFGDLYQEVSASRASNFLKSPESVLGDVAELRRIMDDNEKVIGEAKGD